MARGGAAWQQQCLWRPPPNGVDVLRQQRHLHVEGLPQQHGFDRPCPSSAQQPRLRPFSAQQHGANVEEMAWTDSNITTRSDTKPCPTLRIFSSTEAAENTRQSGAVQD